MIVLDTDAVSFIVRQKRESEVSQQLRNRMAILSAEHEIVTTVVTYEEQTRGWMSEFTKAQDPQGLIDAYNDLLKHLEEYKEMDVIPYTPSADAIYHNLLKQKIRIGTRDLRIAAIALSQDATILTRNLQHFTKVPNLRVKDWTKP